MDMTLFRKRLAKNQGLTITEAVSSKTKKSLDTANKHLDQSMTSLDKAIDSLEDYIDDARDGNEISNQEAREMTTALNNLRSLHRKLEETNNKLPVAG